MPDEANEALDLAALLVRSPDLHPVVGVTRPLAL